MENSFEKFKAQKKNRGLSDAVISERWKQRKNALKQGRRDNNARNRRENPSSYSTVQMSECCSSYSMALVNPWCVEVPPGIPGSLVLPSFKTGGRSRGTLTIGTQGTGWIAANPYGLENSSLIPSSQFLPILTTTALYNSDAYQPYSSAIALSTGVSSTFLDTPLGLDRFVVPGLAYRVVGYGIKIRYVGSEVGRGGRVFAHRNSINAPIVIPSAGATAVLANTLTQNKETSTVPVDRKWHAVLYKPAAASDLAYAERDDIIVAGSAYPANLLQAPSLLLMITGATPGQSFEYDIQGWYEIIGSNLPALTPTFSDPVGMAAIGSANAVHQPETDVEANHKTFSEHVFNAMRGLSGHVVKHVLENSDSYKIAAKAALAAGTGNVTPLLTHFKQQE